MIPADWGEGVLVNTHYYLKSEQPEQAAGFNEKEIAPHPKRREANTAAPPKRAHTRSARSDPAARTQVRKRGQYRMPDFGNLPRNQGLMPY